MLTTSVNANRLVTQGDLLQYVKKVTRDSIKGKPSFWRRGDGHPWASSFVRHHGNPEGEHSVVNILPSKLAIVSSARGSRECYHD